MEGGGSSAPPRGKSWRREREDRERRLRERRGEAAAGQKTNPAPAAGPPQAGENRNRKHDRPSSAALEAKRKAEELQKKKAEEEERMRKEEEEKRQEEERKRKEEEEERRRQEELERQRREEEEQTVSSYIQELEERLSAKAALRERNLAAVNERDEEVNSALDSSLKKNTAFVRKLKCFTEAQKEGIMKDMLGLNLTKYISEVAAALVEVKLKMTDVPAAVELCSALHQRYADFSVHMMENWQKVLTFRRDEKVGNPSKLRVDLRFYADLVSVSVLPRREALPLLGSALTSLVTHDRAEHTNTSLLISFCRHSGEEYAGLTPRRVRQLAQQLNRSLPQSHLLPPEKQKNVRQLFKDYYSSLAKHLLREHEQLLQVRRANRHALQTKGELSAERAERQRAVEAGRDRLLAAAEQLAELVDEPLPQLAADQQEQAERQLLQQAAEDGLLGDAQLVWEDEEQRSFYTSLYDLRASVPSILYRDSQLAAPAAPQPEPGPEEMDDLPEHVSDEHLHEPEEPEPEPELLLDAFLGSLTGRVSRDLIDQAAVEFCMSLNTKNNRRKLVRALFNVPRSRLDLLPFLARLVATLQPCMPDLATDLALMLKADFKYHVRKKDQINIETKLKVMRFIGELVKFGVYSKNEALWCVRVLLNDFTHHHVEMACALLECCGRYLYRTAETHVLTKLYLEQVMRKKAAMPLDSRYVTTIDNMYYTVLPPEGAALGVSKSRPPLHNYMRQLVFCQLARSTTERVVRQLRKLDWSDAELAAYCVKCLSSAWRVRYHNIRCLASLVAALSQYQDSVGPLVVDNVLEDIRLGMEVNQPQFNQRRVSVVRFLGELYNYRLLETAVVFRVLYSLITFGVSLDPQQPSPLDPPGNESRLRLVCVLLDTCGQYFSSGASRRQLDTYLVYLQRYFWSRRSLDPAFPVRLEYLYRDTLSSLRPRLALATGPEEAAAAAERLEAELLLRSPELKAGGDADLPPIAEEQPDQQPPVGEDGDFDEPEPEPGGEVLSEQLTPLGEEDELVLAPRGERDELTDPRPESESASDQERSPGVGGLAPRLVQCSEDDDFLTAFDRMISDSLMDRSREAVKPQFELAAPVSTSGPVRKTYGQLQAEQEAELEPAPSTVTFLLMVRRGNKQLHKSLEVPQDSDLAVSLRSREEAEREERERVKQLTLNINERQEQEEMEELLTAPPSRPCNPNRDRRPKYQHARGAPDADLIFGPKRVNPR